MARKNIKEKRRLQIMEALHKRLLIKPFDQTSIKEIALEAGLNHGMLHYYFQSKEDILLAYIDYSIDLYRTLFTDWLRENEGKFETPDEYMRATMDFMAQKITLNRDLSKIFIEIWEMGIYNEKVREKLQEAYREWITTVTAHLSDQLGRPDTAEILAMMIVAFSEGLSLLSVILKPSDLQAAALIKAFKEILFSSLRASHRL